MGHQQHLLQLGSTWAAAKIKTAAALGWIFLSGESQGMFQPFRKAGFADRYPGTRKGERTRLRREATVSRPGIAPWHPVTQASPKKKKKLIK